MTTRALSAYAASLPDNGRFSLWVGPLDGAPVLVRNADEPHYAASTMKVALVLAAYRRADSGTLDLDTRVPIHDDFDSVVSGERFRMDRSEDSDDQTWQRLGEGVAIRWLANRAIVRSGNLATNLVLEAVGIDAVQDALASVGTADTVISRGIEDAAAREAGHHNLVTAADLALTFQQLAAYRVASPESCKEVLAMLAAQQINDAIPAGLPPGTKVAHKSGWVDGVSHDAGIIYPDDAPPYVLAMCTTSSLGEQEGLDLIAGAARASWQDRAVLS